MHILIIRFSALGDVAMTVPVISSLAKQYPDLKITVLSRPFARAFLENLAPNVNFIGIDLKVDYKGLRGIKRLYDELMQIKLDLVADFHDVLRTKILRLLFITHGVKTAHINKHKAEKRRLCRRNDKKLVQQSTSFQNYSEVLGRLGFPVNLQFKSIFSESDVALPASIDSKLQGERWIGIAPFAAHEGKMYPLLKMEEVVRRLAELSSYRLFLFGGGPEEKKILTSWADKYNRCISVPNILQGLSEELALMSHIDIMVSMDSANMHLASLCDTRVVSIWGATHPFCGFLGWNQSDTDTIQNSDLSCRPCSVFGNKPCFRGDHACMNSISPDDIIHHILQT